MTIPIGGAFSIKARAALTRAAGIVAFLTVVSRILGFIRETSLAGVFGASKDVDAYLMAQAVPLLFLGIVSYALTTTFIPVYSQVRAEKGRDAAFRMANTVFKVVLVVGILLVVLGEVLAEPLVRLVAPGFDEPGIQLTTVLSRIIFPTMVFQLISGIVTGMLQADGKFAAPEAASLVQNVAIILATLIFGQEHGITSVALGLLVGVFGSLVVKLPFLFRLGFRLEPILDIRDASLRHMLILMLPAIIGASTGRLNTLVDRILASGLPEGRVAALNYATRLNALAPAILGQSIVTVIYPTLSAMAANKDWRKFSDHLTKSLGIIFFLLAPIAVGAMVLREPLVIIVYERGAFDPKATQETAWALLFLAGGLATTSMHNLMGRAFFALQDMATPMLIGIVTVGVNISANLLLVGPLEQGGLALGTTIATFVGLVISMAILRSRIPGGLDVGRLAGSVFRTIFAAAVMGVAVSMVHPWFQVGMQDLSNLSAVTELISVAGTALTGAIIYGFMAWLLGIPELRIAIDLMARAQRKRSRCVRV